MVARRSRRAPLLLARRGRRLHRRRDGRLLPRGLLRVAAVEGRSGLRGVLVRPVLPRGARLLQGPGARAVRPLRLREGERAAQIRPGLGARMRRARPRPDARLGAEHDGGLEQRPDPRDAPDALHGEVQHARPRDRGLLRLVGQAARPLRARVRLERLGERRGGRRAQRRRPVVRRMVRRQRAELGKRRPRDRTRRAALAGDAAREARRARPARGEVRERRGARRGVGHRLRLVGGLPRRHEPARRGALRPRSRKHPPRRGRTRSARNTPTS